MVTEAAIIAFVLRLPIKESLLASVLCNLASIGVGSAILALPGLD